jgi:hypothetical protein
LKKKKELEEEKLKEEFILEHDNSKNKIKMESKEIQTVSENILNNEKYKTTVKEISSINLQLGIIKESLNLAKDENSFLKSRISNLTKYVQKLEDEEKKRNESIQEKVNNFIFLIILLF